MIRFSFSILVLCSLVSPAFTESPSLDAKKVQDAAIRLKKAHVEREWDDCLQKSGSEFKCKRLLEVLWEREKAVLACISVFMADPAIDKERLNSEMTACYDPGSTYGDLIRCWTLLADRVDAAKQGKSLIPH
jgi:hypothetical protein